MKYTIWFRDKDGLKDPSTRQDVDADYVHFVDHVAVFRGGREVVRAVPVSMLADVQADIPKSASESK